MQVTVTNHLIEPVLYSTLTKSMMEVKIIPKSTTRFFSPGVCTSHPYSLSCSFFCTVLYGPLFILSHPPSHIHRGWWLDLFPVPAILLLSSMWQSLKGGWWKDPACQVTPSKPVFSSVLVSFCYILFKKLGETPLFFYKPASHTEFIWSGSFFYFLPTPPPRDESFCCFNCYIKRIPLISAPTPPTLTHNPYSPPHSVISFFPMSYFLFLHCKDFIFRLWFLVPHLYPPPKGKKYIQLWSLRETYNQSGILSCLGHTLLKRRLSFRLPSQSHAALKMFADLLQDLRSQLSSCNLLI